MADNLKKTNRRDQIASKATKDHKVGSLGMQKNLISQRRDEVRKMLESMRQDRFHQNFQIPKAPIKRFIPK